MSVVLHRKIAVALYWFKALAPAAVVILGAAVFFRQAVVASILSTPHPELVYVIFGGLALGLLMSWWVLFQYTREDLLLDTWCRGGMVDRLAWVDSLSWSPALAPIYRLLAGNSTIPVRMRPAAVDSELQAAESLLSSRLTLPSYIGGALIGLGLVGTFIGLLGTLQELGALFSSLLNTGSQSTASADMFGDMLRRMQGPLRGMGTAFVASLYGLLGSLLLGLVVLSVRKTGEDIIDKARQSVRDLDYGTQGSNDSVLDLDADQKRDESERWRAMFKTMYVQHQKLIETNQNLQEQTRFVLGAVAEVSASLQERNRIDQHLQRALAEGAHWMDAWDQMLTEIKGQRADGLSHQRALTHLLVNQAEQLKGLLAAALRSEALAVQTAQDRSEMLREGLLDNQELLATLQACRYGFDEAVSKLRVHLNLSAKPT
jgi:hypothetical protein